MKQVFGSLLEWQPLKMANQIDPKLPCHVDSRRAVDTELSCDVWTSSELVGRSGNDRPMNRWVDNSRPMPHADHTHYTAEYTKIHTRDIQTNRHAVRETRHTLMHWYFTMWHSQCVRYSCLLFRVLSANSISASPISEHSVIIITIIIKYTIKTGHCAVQMLKTKQLTKNTTS